MIINPNFNIVFECTYCVYMQVIKTVYHLIFELLSIFSVDGHGPAQRRKAPSKVLKFSAFHRQWGHTHIVNKMQHINQLSAISKYNVTYLQNHADIYLIIVASSIPLSIGNF